MKRSELRRTKRLDDGPMPERKTRMRRRNEARARKRRQRDFGSKAEYIVTHPCCACGSDYKVEPHHHPTRGAGGTSKDLVPLCRACHREYHTYGAETFQGERRVDLTAQAQKYERWWTNEPMDLAY